MTVAETAADPSTEAAPHPTGLTDAAPDVELLQVTKRFGQVVAVDAMTLRIPSGSFTSLLGPSGCGKTTTLRMIAGFEQPTEGEILLAGRPIAGVPPYKRSVNTVFQHYALFPHMDVAQNVGYGLRQKKVAKDEERRRASQALELVRLGGYERRRTWELSGGQQQRVALARALVNRPTVLLLDEPLGALDLKLRKAMQLELKALQQEVGITFVYVTHDQEEALTMSDVIVVMLDGRIQQLGGPEELYERPVNRFVADFIGVSNPIRGPVRRFDASTRRGDGRDGTRAPPRGRRHRRARQPVHRRPGRRRGPPGAADGRAGGHVRRPTVRPAGRPCPGRIKQGTYLGDQTEFRIEHRPGGRADRPPPERHRRDRRVGPRPGRSRHRPVARGCQPRPRWMRLAVTGPG